MYALINRKLNFSINALSHQATVISFIRYKEVTFKTMEVFDSFVEMIFRFHLVQYLMYVANFTHSEVACFASEPGSSIQDNFFWASLRFESLLKAFHIENT